MKRMRTVEATEQMLAVHFSWSVRPSCGAITDMSGAKANHAKNARKKENLWSGQGRDGSGR